MKDDNNAVVEVANGGNITGDLTLTSTDAGATVGASIILNRNSSSPADDDEMR